MRQGRQCVFERQSKIQSDVVSDRMIVSNFNGEVKDHVGMNASNQGTTLVDGRAHRVKQTIVMEKVRIKVGVDTTTGRLLPSTVKKQSRRMRSG